MFICLKYSGAELIELELNYQILLFVPRKIDRIEYEVHLCQNLNYLFEFLNHYFGLGYYKYMLVTLIWLNH